MRHGAISGYARFEVLAFRDRMTRFSGGWIGPYWAQITPLVWIGFLVLLFDFLERVPPIHATAANFVATGVLPYILFRQIITSMSRTVIANRHLRYITPINNTDILLSTAAVEGCNILFTSALIFGSLYWMEQAAAPADIQGVIFNLSLLFLLSTSVGKLIASIGLVSDSWARAFPIFLRPLFWVSGIFYVATELPKPLQDTLSWNPLLHITEGLREAYFLSYSSPIYDVNYTLICICVAFLCSIAFERGVLTKVAQRYRI